MAHTYTNVIIHVVFSTQGRIRSLTIERREEIIKYVASLIREKGGVVIIINGIDDHLHLLFELPPTISLSEIMKFVKSNSSRWFKERFNKPFAWQKGFGAFSVSRSGVTAVTNYIRDQEKHHSNRDFEQEFKLLLDKNGVIYDEEYLWK